MLPTTLFAQWKIGILYGYGYNKYTSDKHYLSDMYNEGKWGSTYGIVGQYDFKSWIWLGSRLGVRAEVNYTNKAYTTSKYLPDGSESSVLLESKNIYLQTPIMLCLSIGNDSFRTFVNGGGYCGFINTDDEWERKTTFGGVIGVGGEYTYKRLTFQGEIRGYADILSKTKSDRNFKTPHYNTTAIFQAALLYNFK